MARAIDRLLVCVYALVIALPVYAMVTDAEDMPLYGVVAEVKRPPLRWRTFRREEYQHELTRWFENHIGYRGFAVRTDNSLLLHGLGEIKRDVGVLLGDDGVLFEKDDIGYHGRLPDEALAPTLAEPFAQKVAALQRRLAAEGRALVPVIIPSKTSVYPDAVPAIWSRAVGEPRTADVEYRDYKRAFDAHGVRYVDARAILTAPTERRDQVWGVHARHWSRYGGCRGMRAVMEQYAALTGTAPVDYPCITVWQPVPFTDVDFDLLNLLNAWGLPEPRRDTPVIVGLAPAATLPIAKPDMLIIGSSFAWTLVHDALRSGLFADLDVYYYNRSLMPIPAAGVVPMEAESAAWRSFIDGREIIVLDLFEPYSNATAYSQEFVEQLTRAVAR